VTVAGFDVWAASYERSALQPVLFARGQQAALDLARRYMPTPRRILDVGCGTARLLRHARQRYPDADLVGIDPAPQMLRTAAAATPAALTIRYVRAAAERLPFAPHTFDLVVATFSLRHWTDPAAGIAETGRVLTPGGVLVIAEVFQSRQRRRRTLTLSRRQRSRGCGDIPAELAVALAAQPLAVIGSLRIPWCKLPDIHVIAAHQVNHTAAGRARTGPPATPPHQAAHQ
jgi:ubiquinone/menaquinone biosynthesis C-methylase UbiE